jgi:polar amino acid transport system substrate-binding protein
MRRVVAAMALALLTLWPGDARAAEELPFAIGEWPPFVSEHAEGYGVVSTIASAVAREMGMTARFSFQPWIRCEEEVLAGRAFATFPYAMTAERQASFDFGEPVVTSRHLFFYYKGATPVPPAADRLEQLAGYRIGGVRGYAYVSPFERAGVRMEFVAEDELNIRKLHAGRVDLVVMDEVLGWTLIRRLFPEEVDRFATAAAHLPDTPLGFMISRTYPGAPTLRERMTRALGVVMQQQETRDLLGRSLAQ